MSNPVVFDKSLGRDWPAIIFVAAVHVLALVSFFTVDERNVRMATWGLQWVFATLISLSIGAGYHRLYSHATRKYKVHPAMESLYLVFGAGAWQTEVRKWAKLHREHHVKRYADTDNDPYGVHRGFWHAHMGWIFWKKPPLVIPLDLARNKLVTWQARYYHLLALTVAFVAPATIAMAWGDGANSFWLNFRRVLLVWHGTFLVNSGAHWWGKRADPSSSARNLGGLPGHLLAFLTAGEGGNHGYHHQHQTDPNIGRWRTIDLSWWWIWLWSHTPLITLRLNEPASLERES